MKRLTAECIQYFHYLSEPCLHRDLAKSALVETVASEPSGQMISRVLEVDHESQERTYLTKVYVQGSDEPLVSELSPQYSPDGRYLAYLCDQTGDKQIYLKDLSTGQVTQVTHLRHGINAYAWAPNSQMISFEAPLWEDEITDQSWQTEMTPDQRAEFESHKATKPIEITEIDYKKDEAFGVFDGSVTQIGLINLKQGLDSTRLLDSFKVSLLTRGQMKCAMPTFSPDSQILYFYGQPHTGPYASRKEVFYVASDKQSGFMNQDLHVTQVIKPDGLILNPNTPVVGSADNDCVYVPAYQMFENGGFAENIIALGLKDETENKADNDTENDADCKSSAIKSGDYLLPMDKDAITLGVYGEPVSKTIYGNTSSYFTVIDNILYFTNIWRGYQNLYRMALDGQGQIEALIENDVNVQAFSIQKSDQKMKIALIGGKLDKVGSLYSDESLEGFTNGQSSGFRHHLKLKCLFDANSWLSDYAIAQTDVLWVESKDQKAKLQVWVVHPVHEKLGKDYPAVLDIHGGPECAYSSDFWHEFQAIAANDMFCVYTNPRGSLGYGPDFIANDACWGDMAFDDLLSAVKLANDTYPIDPQKWGVTGGSYGGYMTNKLIIKTDLFAAAVTQRSLVNTATSYGTGDIGFISAREKDLTYVRMLDFLTARARSTLLKDVDQIKTPLCILHGYQDYRCSFEQSEQLFISMKERHPEVPVRLVMFKGENHGITRTGKCHNQIRHLKEITDWFNHYLKEEGQTCQI